MKKIINFLLFITIILNVSFAFDGKKNNINWVSKKTNKICKQKYIPIDIEQSLNSHSLLVKFTAKSKIDYFSIKNVRGLDGVTISKFQEQNLVDFQKGKSLSSTVEISDFRGMVYVVFDLSITINGNTTEHSIPLPIGVISTAQKKERAKNIKEFKVKSKEGANTLTPPAQKYHEMQAE
jgi:hypothetical protein